MCRWQQVTGPKVQKTTCEERQKENQVILRQLDEERSESAKNGSHSIQEQHPQRVSQRVARIQHDGNRAEPISEVMTYDRKRNDYSNMNASFKTEPDCQTVYKTVNR